MNRQGSDTTTATRRVVILGASARALAQSAAAGGWEVYAADLFGDADLLAVAGRAARLDPQHYPAGLAAAAAILPAAPWCYAGAVENHAGLIDAIAASRPLAGNRGDAVRAVRDPGNLARATRAAGLRYPDTHATPDAVPGDGSFLVKPLASAGGRGIRPWRGDDEKKPVAERVWQRRIGGTPHAAAFLIDRHGPRLIGLSRQLIGAPWCHAGPFSYCGSVVVPPAAVQPAVAEQMVRLGAMLAERFGLVGAVGVDMILDPDGTAWVVEVNPRYTASMELHERASGESIAAAHLAACGFGRPLTAQGSGGGSGGIWAKGVLHAAHAIDITPAVIDRWHSLAAAWNPSDGAPLLADVPVPGQVVGPAAPLLTVFAAGPTAEAAVADVAARAAAILDVSRPSAAASPLHARCTA